ncbi:DUF72 domain-containing protein [Roseateles violae]|uniref:DUF72 domain-containing protein n=1 Tax=Roseateles violae TaxID=3058042 RepID=A0ABT8DP72_9BURK|nr:DUF72 domain-containing protein [Pelomonas sp. PFR6]MDN3919957.1 DUF72 domain-containing protein [Pelomonas sp. PFR6]
MAAAGVVRIGISGWRYAPWRGVFYPPRWPQRLELDFASRMLPTIEINGSFYSLQAPAFYRHWAAQTPDDFVFALKGPRLITHRIRLREVRRPLANFLASGPLALGDKLGPMLWQFPPAMRFDAERFEAFFALLPHEPAEALTLAREHSLDRTRVWLEARGLRRLRHAVEIRHPSFATPEFIALLRRHRIALVTADTAGRWPLLEDLTADFVYLRLHGDQELYASGYGDAALEHWAARIASWRHGGQPADARLAAPDRPPRKRASRDVFCYFDNDVKVHAPYDAAHLAARLGLPTGLDETDRFVPPAELRPSRRRP